MFEEVLAAIEDSNSRRVLAWVNSVNNVDDQVDTAYGGTALHWAVHWGDHPIAKALLAKGASPDRQNNFGATPLHWACKSGDEELVKLLMSYGADVTIQNNTADTPMDVAKESGEMKCLEIMNNPPPPAEKPKAKVSAPPARNRAGGARQATISDAPPTEAPPPGKKSESPHATSPRGRKEVPVKIESPRSYKPDKSEAESDTRSLHSGTASDSKSVGYSTVLSEQIATSTVTTLQRGKIRAEMELVHQQKLVEDLRDQLGAMSKEMFMLQAKAKTFDEMKAKLEQASKEKLRLNFEMKQGAVDSEGKRRMQEHNETLSREKALQDHYNALQQANDLKLKAEKEKALLETSFAKERSDMDHALTKKEAQLDATRAMLATAQAEKTRLEVELKTIESLKDEVIDLRKDKALLEVDLQGMHDLEAEVETMRGDRMQRDLEIKKLQGQLGELQSEHDQLKGQWERAADQLAKHAAVVKELDEQRKDNAKLEVKLASAQEETKQAREIKEVYENNADQATIHLQTSLKLMQQEKEDLGLAKAEVESTLKEIKALNQEMKRQKEIDDTKLGEMAKVMNDNATLKGELSRMRVDLGEKVAKIQELNQSCVDTIRKLAETETELKELRECHDNYTMMEKECLDLRVTTKKTQLELEHLRNIMDSLQSEKNDLEDQNRELTEIKENHLRLQVEHELMADRLGTVEAEVDEYRTGKMKGNYKSGKDMACEIENLNTQLATMEAECNKLELENRTVLEELANKEQCIQDLEGERLEWFAAKEMLKKLENVHKEKSVMAQDLRHLQDLVDEMDRQKKTMEDLLKDRERQLSNREKELDKKNAQMDDLVSAKDAMGRELQNQNTDLKIQAKDLEARLRENERGRAEEYRMMQVEKEGALREAKAHLKHAQGEMQGMKQRLLMMQKERAGLEMQLKALQEAASFLGGGGGGGGGYESARSTADFMSTPLKSIGSPVSPEDEYAEVTQPTRGRSLPPVLKGQKGHVPRPPPPAASKKDFYGSIGSGSGRMSDDYSGGHLADDY